MALNDRLEFAAVAVICCTVVVAVVAGLGSFSLELFATVSIFVLIVLVEVTSSNWFGTKWEQRVQWLLVIGLLVFTVLIANRLLRLIPS